ncbi:MAG TPA: lysophospholipid acyltransferase family protein [Candidatus Deferrimicrobiaceae bacterium]
MTPLEPGRPSLSALRRRKPIRSILLTLLFYPLMAAWIAAGLVAGPLLLLLCRVATGWETDRAMRFLVKVHGYGLIVIVSPFVRLEREGLDGIRLPCILVVNHLSFFDGYFMAALPFFDLTFAVGAWPFRMYWYTAFMRMARYLDVENDRWDDAVAACRRAASKGGAVMFFPEGHRSRTGRLLPFYSGAFRMAIETGLPVVPLLIAGTDVLLPPGNFRLHPARVRMRALPPVDPAAFAGTNGARRLGDHVRGLMLNNLKEMEP